MKIAYLIAAGALIFLLGGEASPTSRKIDENILSGNIRLRLKHGIWKLWKEKPVYQDMFLDLNCHQSKCNTEIWGYAPKFNMDVDHHGIVEIINTKNSIKIQVKMNIKPHPWAKESNQAHYKIELIPKDNQLLGSYSAKYNGKTLQNSAKGIITSEYPQSIPNHQVIKPQEHPRIIFTKEEIPILRKKATTESGKVIIAQLKKALESEIYYTLPQGYGPNGGYHAAAHCFLSILDENPDSAETAWKIVEKSIANPGPRLLEQSSIVAGVALAYDLCYNFWDKQRLEKTTKWLAKEIIHLVNGGGDDWNGQPHSNWNARARSAAGLAALAILKEPEEFFPSKNTFISNSSDTWLFLKKTERNIQRYLKNALGESGFGTEGDLYTRESVQAILPFIVGYRNVLGKNLVKNSNLEWILPHYMMRMVEVDNRLEASTYGAHRVSPDGALFALGLGSTSDRFLEAAYWFFNRHYGLEGDQTFGINEYAPHEAIFLFADYREEIQPQNPTDILDKVLIDRQKGFFAFRNQWQDENDIVASIYLKQEPLGQSWSFPDVGSFRISGLGKHWAKAGPGDGKNESENVVFLPKIKPWRISKPIFFKSRYDGSSILSLRTNNFVDKKSKKGLAGIRSFAVDYSKVSGVPALFVIADKFLGDNNHQDFQDKTWIMHTDGKVSINGQSFTISGENKATMEGTFVAPSQVKITYQDGKILATGGNEFLVVMTLQKGDAPPVEISGTGLNAKIRVGGQRIGFNKDKIELAVF